MPDGNIPQSQPVLFEAPKVGEPFNFNIRSTGTLIERAIMEFPGLSHGAKLLWGVIRNQSQTAGVCWSRRSILASRIGCSRSQITRLRAHLVERQLLRVTDGKGDTWGCQLLWHENFALADAGRTPPVTTGRGPHLLTPLRGSAHPIHTGLLLESSSGKDIPAAAEDVLWVARELKIDDDAAAKLLTRTRQVEPSVTAREVVMLARDKISQTSGTARNIVGLVLVTVPRMASGELLAHIRRRIAHESLAAMAEQADQRRLAEEILTSKSDATGEHDWTENDRVWARAVLARP